MASQWYCQLMGTELGPFTSQQLIEMARSHRLMPDDSVKKGADGAWVAAHSVKGLFDDASASTIIMAILPPEVKQRTHGHFHGEHVFSQAVALSEFADKLVGVVANHFSYRFLAITAFLQSSHATAYLETPALAGVLGKCLPAPSGHQECCGHIPIAASHHYQDVAAFFSELCIKPTYRGHRCHVTLAQCDPIIERNQPEAMPCTPMILPGTRPGPSETRLPRCLVISAGSSSGWTGGVSPRMTRSNSSSSTQKRHAPAASGSAMPVPGRSRPRSE